jgi:dihydroxyacetone kinase-like protein
MTAAAPVSTRPAETLVIELLGVVCDRLLAATAELNALDRAIGDGDHGDNLARAARRLREVGDELALLPLPELIARAGKEIVMSVGGASGPLYGTLLLEIGKALPADPAPADWTAAFASGVDATARRGRSAEGDKTMIDVLAPSARALCEHAATPRAEVLAALRDAAQAGFDASRPLRARRGRAAFVGERAAGANDPGAASSLLCLSTIVEFLAEIPE